MIERHLWEYRPARDVLWALGIAALLAAGYLLRGVLGPIIVALLLAHLFNPMISWLAEHARIPRGLTAFVLAASMAAISVAVVGWGAPMLVKQVDALRHQLPKYLHRLSLTDGLGGSLAPPIEAVVSEVEQDPAAALRPIVGGDNTTETIKKAVGTTLVMMLNVVVVPIYFMLFAWRFDRMATAIWRVLPVARYPRLAVLAARFDAAFGGFFKGRFLIALISTGLYAAGWGLAQVPYWSLLSVAAGVLTIVPYASIVTWPLAVLLKYLEATGAQPDWVAIAFWPSIVYILVGGFEGWILTPFIQSQTNEMSAAAVLIALFVGGELGGVLGMLLAVPLWSCAKAVFEMYVLPKLLDDAERAT